MCAGIPSMMTGTSQAEDESPTYPGFEDWDEPTPLTEDIPTPPAGLADVQEHLREQEDDADESQHAENIAGLLDGTDTIEGATRLTGAQQPAADSSSIINDDFEDAGEWLFDDMLRVESTELAQSGSMVAAGGGGQEDGMGQLVTFPEQTGEALLEFALFIGYPDILSNTRFDTLTVGIADRVYAQ